MRASEPPVHSYNAKWRYIPEVSNFQFLSWLKLRQLSEFICCPNFVMNVYYSKSFPSSYSNTLKWFAVIHCFSRVLYSRFRLFTQIYYWPLYRNSWADFVYLRLRSVAVNVRTRASQFQSVVLRVGMCLLTASLFTFPTFNKATSVTDMAATRKSSVHEGASKRKRLF
jgi:hypothetical protein